MNELEEMRQAKDEIERANQASQVINNPIFIEAITIMKVDAVGMFETSSQSDEKKHKEAWLQLNAINELQSNLIYIMENGKAAEHELTFLEKAKKLTGL